MSVIDQSNSSIALQTDTFKEYVTLIQPSSLLISSASGYIVPALPSTTTIALVQEAKTVVSGVPGPRGPEGISEENKVYAKRIDFINDAELYRGEAPVGSLESDSTWRIRKITIAADSDVTVAWAEGSAEFNKIWQDRLSYQYI